MSVPTAKLFIPQGSTYVLEISLASDGDSSSDPNTLSTVQFLESSFREDYDSDPLFTLSTDEGTLTNTDNSITVRVTPQHTNDLKVYSGVFDIKAYFNHGSSDELVLMILRGTFKIDRQSTRYKQPTYHSES